MCDVPAQGVNMSSTFVGYEQFGPWDANRCADGDVTTTCASGYESEPWVSIEVAPMTKVGFVRIYNSAIAGNRHHLKTFEVWLGTSVGDTTSAHAVRCDVERLADSSLGPFVVGCGGASVFDSSSFLGADKPMYVTLILTGAPRWLSLSEVGICRQPGSPSPRPRAASLRGSAQLTGTSRTAPMPV